MEYGSPHLYSDLASWFHLLTSPEEYADEASEALLLLSEAIGQPPRTILELGSGGGNNASHMKAQASLTLTDLSADMIDISRALNPGCEHVQGDMTTLRLAREFDAVFVHDAVCYLTTEDQLLAAFETAFVHCRPGGAALFAPDYVRERFHPGIDHGGHDGGDGDGRALRYLEWTWDPDPTDTQYLVDFAYLLRDAAGQMRVVHDRHVEGLFPLGTWLGLLEQIGFSVEVRHSSDDDKAGETLFLARKP